MLTTTAMILAATTVLVWNGPAHADSAAPPPISVTVRVYGGEALSAPDRTQALSVAGRIMETAALRIAWLDCTPTPGPQHPCAQVPQASELRLRVVRGAVDFNRRGFLPLGDSLVDLATRSGTLATIYIDRVRWLSNATHTDVRVLTGRAIAHEIGHLLLGSNEHTSRGLMRARWSHAELRDNRREDWEFTRPNQGDLRRAVEARAGEALFPVAPAASIRTDAPAALSRSPERRPGPPPAL